MLAPVDAGMFRDIIHVARACSGPGRPLERSLVFGLSARPPRDVMEFQQRFDQLHATLYRQDVWAAAYLIGGGCGPDPLVACNPWLSADARRAPRHCH
jgi:hypothetical protein